SDSARTWEEVKRRAQSCPYLYRVPVSGKRQSKGTKKWLACAGGTLRKCGQIPVAPYQFARDTSSILNIRRYTARSSPGARFPSPMEAIRFKDDCLNDC